jgi:hypothetical protein
MSTSSTGGFVPGAGASAHVPVCDTRGHPVHPMGRSSGKDREEGRGEIQAVPREGLCSICQHARTVRSSKGSTFLLCGLARENPAFAKYPPQPVVSCSGFAR